MVFFILIFLSNNIGEYYMLSLFLYCTFALKRTNFVQTGPNISLKATAITVNPVNMLNTLTKVLAEGKGGIVRDRLKD